MACKANRNKIPVVVPWILGLLLILSCAGFQGLSPHRDEISTVYVEQGMDFYNHKDFTGAIEKFTKAIEADPANARAYLQRSQAYLATDETDKALSDLTQAINLDPENADAYILRSSVYFLKKEYGKVIDDCDRALELTPKEHSVFFIRGAAYAEMQKYDQALDDLNQAIDLDPNPDGDFYAYRQRGIVELDLFQLKQGMEDLEKALELAPNEKEKQAVQDLISETTASSMELEGITVNIDVPSEVRVGDHFVLQINITNTKKTSQELDSIDIYESYLDGVGIDKAVPAYLNDREVTYGHNDPLEDYHTYAFSQTMAANSSTDVQFNMVANTAGDYEGLVFVCVNSPTLCNIYMIQTVVKD
jgi:tetratricopeptide (TPR) repeat protein